MNERHAYNKGFTLIELSIVLVIIGLIIGGILVGQDLIKAAATRAQLAQIEKYQTAVNTFRGKYGYLPGDIPDPYASQFGFAVGANCTGQQGGRDGNGLIDGFALGVYAQAYGETGQFWTDLSTANLIDGQFPNGGAAAINCGGAAPILSWAIGSLYFGDYFPTGKVGNNNIIYVYELSGQNWFGLSAATSTGSSGGLFSSPGASVSQAYNIDKKIDDGLPITGTVQAVFLNGTNSTPPVAAPNGNPDTTSTCYNNSTNAYSTNISNGSNPNCALSFRMQGAAR